MHHSLSGVWCYVQREYPEVWREIEAFREEIERHDVAYFEAQAGVRFIDCLKGHMSNECFLSRERFASLPRPIMAWQARLFIYCELRVLDLFDGRGYTILDDGKQSQEEFLCSNFELCDATGKLLPNVRVIDVEVEIPEFVRERFESSSAPIVQ